MKTVETMLMKNKALIYLCLILFSCHEGEQSNSNGLQRYETQSRHRMLTAGRRKFEVKLYTLDFDHNGIDDTIKAYNKVYGAGINQPIPEPDMALGHAMSEKAYCVMANFYLIRGKKELPLIKLQKEMVFMAFPPFPADSFILEPLYSRTGCRIKNVCVETTPEITYLELVKLNHSYSIRTCGRINISHENYMTHLPNDTCVAATDIGVDTTRRLSFTELVLGVGNNEWRCFGSRNRGVGAGSR